MSAGDSTVRIIDCLKASLSVGTEHRLEAYGPLRRRFVTPAARRESQWSIGFEPVFCSHLSNGVFQVSTVLPGCVQRSRLNPWQLQLQSPFLHGPLTAELAFNQRAMHREISFIGFRAESGMPLKLHHRPGLCEQERSNAPPTIIWNDP